MKLCKCGCGKQIYRTSIWAPGHHRKGKHGWSKGLAKETHPGIKSQSEKILGRTLSEELKNRLSVIHIGHPVSDATKKKLSEGRMGEENWAFGKPLSVDHRRKLSVANSNNEKVKKANLGRKFNLSEEAKQRKRQVALKNLPALLEGAKNIHYDSPERSKKLSEAKKKQWEDPEFAQMMFECLKKRPNIPEKELDTLFQLNFPNQIRYIGDGKFWVNRKNPDFKVNGEKKLIELFGSYWHKSEDEEVRKSHFKKYGFYTLVIWEQELKNPSQVVSKVNEFLTA